MNIQIKNASNEPIYLQIKKQLKDAIISGELEEDAQLPSIRFLAKELRVSVITTKRAYDELEREGFLHSVQGKGSFVAAQNRAPYPCGKESRAPATFSPVLPAR